MADGRQAEFEAVFSLGGIWTTVLNRADGYLLTESCCESPEKRQYRVRDFWKWHRNFENFRAQFQSRYGEFESRIFSDGLVEKEQFLGAYYEKQADGNDLVPS